jgi:hypothetical protein
VAVVLTDWLAVVTALGVLLSGLGLLGTMATVVILARQTRAVQQATVSAAYQSIIAQGSAHNRLFFEHPEVYQALRDPDLTVERWDFDEQMQEHPQVTMVIIQQLDYFELVLVTMVAFPRSLQDEWRDYIRGILGRSPYMRRCLLDTDWYTAELRALAEAIR